MAIPDTLYAVADVQETPSSSVSDFTFIVDLSNLPQTWWDAVDTSDGTRGRISKADGTELASDWIEFDDVGETGFVRVLWTGTAVGSETIRIYPPQTTNSSYLESDTFGAYNAYDTDWGFYAPLGGGNDRTSNQFDLSGTITEGNATGQVGSATEYDGTDSFKRSAVQTTGSANRTFLFWRKDSIGGENYLTIGNNDDVGPNGERWTVRNNDDFLRIEIQGSGYTSALDLSGTAWKFAGCRLDGTTLADHTLFLDGSNESATGTDTVNTADTTPETVLGGRTDDTGYLSGLLDEVQLHTTARSNAWIEHERLQTSNNATFWGAWTIEGAVDAPTVDTNPASVISDDVTLNGEITDDGGGTISERGFYYGTTSGSLGTKVVEGGTSTGTFSDVITGLSNGTYYFEAFATNEEGESRGDELSFVISAPDVRYRITHKEAPGGTVVTYRAEITDENFSGSVTEKLASRSFFDWEYDQIDERDIFSRPVQKSSFDINFIVQSDLDFDFISDILDANQNRFQINFYIDGVLQWSGKVLNDLLEYPEAGYPYTAKIKAKDLSRLSAITSEAPDLEYNRRLIELIADCLKETGLSLPIRSYTNLTHSEVTQANDFLHEIYHAREAFETNDGPMSCMNVLENICRAYNLIIRQSGARWIIEQIPAVAKGDATQYDYDVNGANPTSSTPSRTQGINGISSYILPTSENIVTGALKKIESVYNHRTLIHEMDTEDVTYSSDPAPTPETFRLEFDNVDNYRLYFSTDVEVDADTTEGIEGTAYLEVKGSAPSGTDQYLTSAGTWSTSQADIEIDMSGASGSMSGSFEVPDSGVIGDLTEEIIVSLKWADASLVGGASQTVTEVRWRNTECYVFHSSLQDSSASIRYRYTRSGDYYVTEDVGTTVLGDGPTQGDNTASNGRPASGELPTTVLEPGDFRIRDSGENVLLEKLTLRERVNMRRTALRNLRANMWVNYTPEKLISYNSGTWFFLGGYFSAKGSRWTANIIQLSYDGTTAGDTFEEITVAGGGASGTSGSSGGSSGGLTETEANDLYLRHDLNLSEVESKPAARTNLGLEIGEDVQGHSVSLDTYVANSLSSGELQQLQNIDTVTISNAQWGGLGNLTESELQQVANINSSTISATQWGYVGNLDQNLRTTDDVTFANGTFNGRISGFTGQFSRSTNDVVNVLDLIQESSSGSETTGVELRFYGGGDKSVVPNRYASIIGKEKSASGGNIGLDFQVASSDTPFVAMTLNESGDAIYNYNILYKGSITSDNFADAAGLYSGADLSQDTLRIETIRANELRVKAFVAEVSAALYGEDILTKSRGVVSRNFTVPAVGNTATLYVEDLEGLSNTAVFEVDDWVRLTFVDRGGGGLDTATAWGKVTNYTDLSGGEQSWTWTTESGTTGDVINKGSVAIDYGTSGDSVIVRSVIGDNTPRDTQLTWVTDPSDANNYTIITRVGNLGGIPNTTGSGFYGENSFFTESFIVGDLTKTGNYIEYASGNLTMETPQLSIDASGNADFSGTLSAPDGEIGGFFIGATSLSSLQSNGQYVAMGTADDLPWSTGIYGFHVGKDEDNTIRFGAGGGGNFRFQARSGGNTLFELGEVVNRIAGFDFDNEKLTTTGLTIQGGATPFIEVSDGEIRNPSSDYVISDTGIFVDGSTSAGGTLETVGKSIQLGGTNGTASSARIWVDSFVQDVNELVIDNATRMRVTLRSEFKSLQANDYVDVDMLQSEPASPATGSVRIFALDDGSISVKFSNGDVQVLASTNI